ncbi:hypothetical protein [Salipiger sp.]
MKILTLIQAATLVVLAVIGAYAGQDEAALDCTSTLLSESCNR